MTSYRQILYQIVFSTKHRERTLIKRDRPELFRYMAGVVKKQNCHLYQLNGVEDHLHIVTDIHPSLALADLVKDIKLSANSFIKEGNILNNFVGWQKGYGAFTYHVNSLQGLIKYVKTQEEHHRALSYEDEYRKLLEEHHIEFDERCFLD